MNLQEVPSRKQVGPVVSKGSSTIQSQESQVFAPPKRTGRRTSGSSLVMSNVQNP